MQDNYRTVEYTVWRACECLGTQPPGVRDLWDDSDVWAQAMIIAYEQVRE